jgi:excisionase family DNA binding protein
MTIVETSEPKAYSPESAAKQLGVSLTTLRRWLKDGLLGYVQPDRRILIPESELTRFLARLKVSAK